MESLEHLETKNCPLCAEATAKICPRCRQWLTFRSYRHPLVSLLIFLAIGLGVVWVIFAGLKRVETLINPPPYYSDFRGSIHVLKANMNWVETSDGPRLFLTGVLTNQGQIAWRSPEFECRFFDWKGQLVDAANGSTFLTVLPGADSAFRVSVKPGLPSNEYGSFQISVSNARNVKGPF